MILLLNNRNSNVIVQDEILLNCCTTARMVNFHSYHHLPQNILKLVFGQPALALSHPIALHWTEETFPFVLQSSIISCSQNAVVQVASCTECLYP